MASLKLAIKIEKPKIPSMAIRNRLISLIYRSVLLIIAVTTLIVSYPIFADVGGFGAFISSFEAQTTVFATLIIAIEVLIGALTMKYQRQALPSGVWTPLYVASISFVLYAEMVAPILCLVFNTTPYFPPSSVSGAILLRIVLPIMYLLDYILFGEKGTATYISVTMWVVYPAMYVLLFGLIGSFNEYGTYFYPFLAGETFAHMDNFLSANEGGIGVLFATIGFAVAYMPVGIFMVFLSDLLSGKFIRRSDDY